MNTLKKINTKLHTPLWLFILLVVVIILRIPSFFEPYSYGDEMIYLVLGEALRQGVPLYSAIHDNKPPLLYITAGIAGSLFWFKVILAIWHIVTVYIFWRFVEKLFPGKKVLHKSATILFALFTTFPLLEGNIANAELFMIGPIILAFHLLWPGKDTTPKLIIKKSFAAGLLFSLATLYKVPGAFDIPAIIFLWIISFKPTLKNFKTIFVNSLFISFGFALPILITFIVYWAQGALREYAIAAFLQNFGYLSSWRPDDVKEPFLVKNGPLLIRAGITALGMGILWFFRKKLSRQFIFTVSWLLLTLFAVTLSERPYPHYLIQSIAPLAILAAILITIESIEQALVIIPLALAFYVPVHFNFWHYQTFSYYERFVKYTTQTISKEKYLSSFDGNLVRNYKVAEFIVNNSEKDEKIFVWGNSSVIYALSRRLPPIKYVADYHISDFSSREETLKALQKNPPKIIVILPDSSEFSELRTLLKLKYGFITTLEGADIWTHIPNKPY